MYIQNRRTLIIITAVVGVLLISLAIAGFVTQKDATPSQDRYNDPSSGETVVKDPNSAQGDQSADAIVYPGFSKLIDRGLTPIQVQSVQVTLAEYSFENKKDFTEVSLVTDSVRHILPAETSTTHSLTFDIKVNRETTYYVTVEYQNTTDVVTRLYSADKKTLLIER
jgi:hypothetical protein